MLLQEHYWRSNSNNDRTQPLHEVVWDDTYTAVERLSGAAVSYLTNRQNNPNALKYNSFLLAHCIYQTASVLMQLGYRRPDRVVEERKENCKTLLGSMSKRWRLAGKS